MINEVSEKIKKCLPEAKRNYQVHEPFFDEKSTQHVNKCINSNYVSSYGDYINKFSNKLQKITNAKHILLTNSGTSALFLALKLIEIENTEVLVPTMTFVATVNSIIYNNATPHFIDCEKDTLNIDIKKLTSYMRENFIMRRNKCFNKKNKKYIKCIIGVHAYGVPMDSQGLKKLCKKYNIEVIEDAAGALGSYFLDKHVGIDCRASIISFNGNKIVTTGNGGAILLKNKKDFLLIKHLMSTARLQHPWKVQHDSIGYNMRMSNINASLGYDNLCNLDKHLVKKRKLFQAYHNTFNNCKYCFIQNCQQKYSPNHWVINLYLYDEYKKYHQSLIKNLHSLGLHVRELWTPQHLNEPFKKFPKSNLSNAVNNWKRVISLPSSYYK